MNNYLLDTSAVIEFIRGSADHKVWVAQNLRKNNVLVPNVVIAELKVGIQTQGMSKFNKLIEKFTENLQVISFQEEHVNDYARIRVDLMRKGSLIPEVDMQIAAIAVVDDYILITKDRHFERVDGLRSHKLYKEDK